MEPRDLVGDRLHDETQVHDDGSVDLTVSTIEAVVEPGRIDFGGGELEAAETEAHESHYRNPDDDYEWWDLDEGQYLASFNETLDGDATAVLQPRDALLARGATLPTVRTRSLDPLPLSVGGAGLLVKENARIATVVDVLA